MEVAAVFVFRVVSLCLGQWGGKLGEECLDDYAVGQDCLYLVTYLHYLVAGHVVAGFHRAYMAGMAWLVAVHQSGEGCVDTPHSPGQIHHQVWELRAC